MRKKAWLVIAGLILLLSIPACEVRIYTGNWAGETIHGSGVVVQENRSVSGISGVELAMQGTLHIELGSSESLRIEAEDNLLGYIETDVRAGRLEIHTREGTSLENTRPIDYYLTLTQLDTIVLSSSGDAEVGDLRADRFSATINSSGSLSIASLDCTSLQVQISSSGDVNIAELTADTIRVGISSSGNLEIAGGQVQQQDVAISSSGQYRARDLASAQAEVTLTSSGTATVRVSDHLRGSLNSSGNLYYVGHPEVDVTTNSSGRAVQISE